MTTRRQFLTNLAAAASAAGVAGAPKFSFGQTVGGKTLIKVFARGGADGLHLFPKYNDPFYYQYRPDIGIEPPNQQDMNTAIDLGMQERGMNPNLAALTEIWEDGNMMIAPATSFEENNRSHFDCQRWIGTGSRNNFIDGYLNRYMQSVDGTDHPLRGIVAGRSGMTTELRGSNIRVPTVERSDGLELRNRFLCSGTDCADNQLTEMMREIASHDVDLAAVDKSLRETQLVMLDTIEEVQRASANYTPNPEAPPYSNSGLGRGLQICAQLLKAGVPLEVAGIDWNIGWDTHADQIAGGTDRFTDQNKGYHRGMVSGASDFLAFYKDMGTMMNDVVVLVGSEFGRTKKQNGSTGTDHGVGGGWFAYGGPVRRGIAQDVSSIDDTVVDRNWVPNLVSYRDIVGEIMVRHMGMDDSLISTVFDGHQFTDLGLMSATS